MTTKDLAVFFGKSEKTIHRCAEDAGIPFQNGVKKIFTKEEVEKLSHFIFDIVTIPQAICRLVETSAEFTGKPIPKVWDNLYSHFEYAKNVNYRRLAYVNGATILATVVELGDDGELLEVARGFLKQIPALPVQKEKAPVQGSLIEEGGLP